MHISEGNGFSRSWNTAPFVLRGLFGFCVVAAVLSMSVFFNTRLNESLIPYVGWSGLSIYMTALIFVVYAIFTPTRQTVYGVALILTVGAITGVMQAVPHFTSGTGTPNDFGNPYLRYSPLSPLFTVAVPLLWIVLLFTPAMVRWVKAGNHTPMTGTVRPI